MLSVRLKELQKSDIIKKNSRKNLKNH
ncbi:MAG: hypothetical protein MUP85_21490 [Candidatus Lokiarchaeota archaeon]|nr:hypothetical protein [Candidatus Lokiarchaeota archaeon]